MTIALEVTDRVRARQRTEAIEERRRLAFEASGAGTWHMELTTRLVTRDATLNRILGLRAVETLAPVDDYLARLHPDDRASVAEAFEHSIRTGDDYQIEARIIRPDGTTGWVRDVGRVLRGSNARPIAFAGAMVDITAYKHADEQREEASRAKDDFLAMLGHELRNPLAPIVTAVELMKLRGEAASKEREIIERQLQHLNRLVDDLLDISRITRGAIELKRESLVLSDVVAKALEIAAPLFEEKGHHAEIDVPRSLCVVGDPVRLAQVFANLLTNAARYTPRGGHISVAAAHDTDRTIVRVTDDGIGISPEMLDRIFDLFVQGRRGTARSEGGLGIGLALVKNLVRMHGGEVSAHSRGPGTGSEFVVELPDMPGAKVTNRPPPAVPRGQHRRRVLVVDDNIDASELLAELIREIGHDVAVAHDGPQALAMIDHFRPEVAILDIGLPAMDGYELARQIREHGFAHCRMIALTGYGHDRDRARSRDAGFDAHLVKPVDLRMLASVVDAN